MVCAEWEFTDPETGKTSIRRESYSFDVMNDLISGRVPPETLSHHAGAVERVRTSVTRVETCDDARKFTELRNSWEKEHPLESIPTPIRKTSARGTNGPASLPEPSIERADPLAHTYTDPMSIKVADGVTFSPEYAVMLDRPGSQCSGLLIGPNTLLTAAHCVPLADGAFFTRVTYGEGLACLNPFCSTPEWPNVWGIRFPGYTGVGDWSRDLAVVFGMSNWLPPANDPQRYVRLLDQGTADGEQFFIEGYGWTANEGGSFGTAYRSSFFEIIEVNLGGQFYSTVTVSKGRSCKGDSGGPAVNHNLIGKAPWFTPVAIGVTVGHDELGWPWPPRKCPDLGFHNFFSRISNKLDWLDDRRAEFQLSECYRGSSNGNKYRRCF